MEAQQSLPDFQPTRYEKCRIQGFRNQAVLDVWNGLTLTPFYCLMQSRARKWKDDGVHE
jgi:hypothetical protein